MKKISIVNPCFNEEMNVLPMYQAVKKEMSAFPDLDYEHIFIDNHSTDKTESILRKIALEDTHVKALFNLKNYGPDRSGMYAVFRATGDAVIVLPTDFQEPPELIPEFIKYWLKGNKLVLGQRTDTENKGIMNVFRSIYYKLIKKMSENEELENVTGFGLYDKEIIDWIKWIDSPEPQLRTMVTMLGYEPVLIPYKQKKREHGKSSYSFLSYCQAAFVNLVATSMVPLRTITVIGFVAAGISFLVGIVYLVYKLIFWNSFNAGMAPIMIGLFLLGSIQLVALGVLGEYIGSILLNVKKRPLVLTKEEINTSDEEMKKVSTN